MAAYQKKVCCVKNCPALNVEGLTYYSLPIDIERQASWIQIIGSPDINHEGTNSSNYICSVHFDKSQFGILKQAPSDTLPTRHIPAKRKGVYITVSTTASQTDFTSSDDDEDRESNNEIGYRKKHKLYYGDEKVIIYKRAKPNREMFVHCEINCEEEKEIDDDGNTDIPCNSLICSDKETRNIIESGNRKLFVFTEDRYAVEDASNVPDNKTDRVLEIAPIPVPTLDKSTGSVETEQLAISNPVTSNIVISKVISLNNPVDEGTFGKFFEWKLRTTDRRKGPIYNKEFEIFALHLHTINTRAYRLLIDAWQLPKENILKKIHLKIRPKIDKQVTKLLSQKLKLLSKEGKYCTISLCAMELKPQFYYDTANDEVIGVCNVNGVTTKMAARYALIAMVRGIKVPWHLPVAFSLLSTKTDADGIEVFLKNLIAKLNRMDVKIRGVVMSDDPCFWDYCTSKHYISTNKLYLSIDQKRIYCVFDIPSVLNRFKEEFIGNDITYDDKIVSFKYVQQVYDLDRQNGGKLLGKLLNSSEEYLKPIQVFNGTISAAMQFYIDHGQITEYAIHTAEFIKKISEQFDVLNVTKVPIDNLRNRESQMKTLATAQVRALENAHYLFKKVKFIQNDGTFKNSESLKYFLISLKSLVFISMVLNDEKQIGIARTRLCSLEPLQEFLKSVGDHAKTIRPTPMQFTRAFSELFVKYLIELTPPPKSVGDMGDFLKMADGVKDCSETYEGKRICLKDTDYRFTLPIEYPIIYVSSYLLYKCFKMHECKTMEEYSARLVDLNKTKVNAHFENFNKDAMFYEHLKLPTMSFVSYIERLDNCFTEKFPLLYHTTPAENIFNDLLLVPKWEYPCPCFPKDYLLRLFVRTRIYQTVFYNSKCLKSTESNSAQSYLKVKKL